MNAPYVDSYGVNLEPATAAEGEAALADLKSKIMVVDGRLADPDVIDPVSRQRMDPEFYRAWRAALVRHKTALTVALVRLKARVQMLRWREKEEAEAKAANPLLPVFAPVDPAGMNFSACQAGHRDWAYRNFGVHSADDEARVLRSFLGVVEEVGELSHALLKSHQGIRGTAAEHEAKAKDAVGDTVLFLMDLCNRKGWDVQQIMEDTTREVWARDWTKNKATGTAEAA